MNSQSQLIRTIAKKRTANFREDETRLLIQLWGSPQIQNRLNLTHRKAPVMRLIAANMQQRGFYRSPDEIKTRIRNLKCLYHRIKRTITSGSGIGTVDPDWPHFKAMDAILGDSTSHAATAAKLGADTMDRIKPDLDGNIDTHFEIKQELDINDDLESWNGNESVGSEYDDELTSGGITEPAITITTPPVSKPSSLPTPTSNTQDQPNKPASITTMGQTTANQQQILTQQLARTITCTPQTTIRPAGQNLTLPPSIPLPFLILNNLKPAQNAINQQANVSSDGGPPNKKRKDGSDDHGYETTLSQLLEIQKKLLDVDKERLEIEKQRLEFDRLVGSQLMTLVPMMASLVQRLIFPNADLLNKSFDLRTPDDQRSENNLIHDQMPTDDDMEPLLPPPTLAQSSSPPRIVEDELEKNRNILRNLLNEGLKARMLEEQNKKEAEKNTDKNGSNAGSGNDAEKEDTTVEAHNEKDKDEADQETRADDEQANEDDNEENDDNESCVLLINEENSSGGNDENN